MMASPMLTIAILLVLLGYTKAFAPTPFEVNRVIRFGERSKRYRRFAIPQPVEAESGSDTRRKVRRRAVGKLVLRSSSIPRKAVKIYGDYFQWLWRETSVEARHRIARDKTASAIRSLENVLNREEFSEETSDARQQLLDACDGMISELGKSDKVNGDSTEMQVTDGSKKLAPKKKKKKKQRRSILFGALMGAAVTCWVFSGNWVFTGLFTLMTILGQLEYYRMVINTGVYPARRISVVGACSMFLTVSLAHVSI